MSCTGYRPAMRCPVRHRSCPTRRSYRPIPEISVARREAQHGAAKIAMFAYDRETRRPVWQSGISKARSTVQDTWVLGAGPFQRGTNVDGTQFAGTELRLPHLRDDGTFDDSLPVNYGKEHLFQPPTGISAPSMVNVAGFVDSVSSATAPTPHKPAPPADAEAKKKEATAPAAAAASEPAAASAEREPAAPAPSAPAEVSRPRCGPERPKKSRQPAHHPQRLVLLPERRFGSRTRKSDASCGRPISAARLR